MSAIDNSSAPIAGPTKNPMLSIVEETTLAPVSSRGLLANDGSSAAWAGRNAVPRADVTRATPYTTRAGASASMAMAPTTTRATRDRSAAIITARFEYRSANVDSTGPTSERVT